MTEAIKSPGKEHTAFMQWAISQGMKINGVSPARFPDRGLGLMATRTIKEGEVMVAVPLSTMLTVNNVPASFANQFTEGISVHGLLSAYLTHGDPEVLKKYEIWRKTWPTRADFEDTLPLMWPKDLRASNSKYDKSHSPSHGSLLPPCASGLWNSIKKRHLEQSCVTKQQNLLSQQEERLHQSWKRVLAVYPDTDWDTFSYHWCIVNTRSFHFRMPGKEPPKDRHDAMALVPFADYFNHVDNVKCDVKFDGKYYTFKATRQYEPGEEIYMSYGTHPNDVLFIEYGFFLNENASDTLYLDDIIFRDLSSSQIEELLSHEYYGNYQITASSGPCFRTEIAACMKYLSLTDWRNYVLGYSTLGVDATKTNAVIRGWIEAYVREAKVTMGSLDDLLKRKRKAREERDEARINKLMVRWEGIKALCETVMEELQ